MPFLSMDSSSHPLDLAYVLGIVVGFLIFFPGMWCGICWLLSRLSGWHRLAAHYASSSRPVTGTLYGGVSGQVGFVSYRGVLTMHADTDGFFVEVMALFRVGHPRLFIPWSEISASEAQTMFFSRLERLGIGQPVVATLALPAYWVKEHRPG